MRNKYFEFIPFNTFIYLLILLKSCINYIQVKCIENWMEKYLFAYVCITVSWRAELQIHINIKNLEYRKFFSLYN